MELYFHPYQYYPYERDLALREVQSLTSAEVVSTSATAISVEGPVDASATERLVYFNSIWQNKGSIKTLQARLEEQSARGRQSTRYSVHGLHEYKGKFNPQVVRALLNILGIRKGDRVLDPFCGSGTTLIECAHIGISAVGTDINPLAVFVANAKFDALRTPADILAQTLEDILSECQKPHNKVEDASERDKYLTSWFVPQVLAEIEAVRRSIYDADHQNFFLAVASNLLREYSLQDPADLRIRRRKTPLPDLPFTSAFKRNAEQAIAKLKHVQNVLTDTVADSVIALLMDIRNLKNAHLGEFDCALTSPPYATALPYIDTQRLSLVWLNLVLPSQILPLDGILIGSREIRGESKNSLRLQLSSNRHLIPVAQAKYCEMLQDAVSGTDGFRRQAVPLLLYRYFVDMVNSFRSVRSRLKLSAPYAMIVGANHTILGGKRFDIDTPEHLVNLAEANGFVCDESIPLQTYSRYGYHATNAVTKERLLVFRAS